MKVFWHVFKNVYVTTKHQWVLRLSHVEGPYILGEVQFVWLLDQHDSDMPSTDKLRLDQSLKGSLYVHVLVEELSDHESYKFGVW